MDTNNIQYNLNGSNPDGSLTLDDSNSFFQSLQNPSNSSRKQIFKDFFLFYYGIVCCLYSLESPLEAILMSTLNIQLLCRRSIDFPELAILASRSGAKINLHWFELPMARIIFHGPKGVRAIEVRLYFIHTLFIVLGQLTFFLYHENFDSF